MAATLPFLRLKLYYGHTYIHFYSKLLVEVFVVFPSGYLLAYLQTDSKMCWISKFLFD